MLFIGTRFSDVYTRRDQDRQNPRQTGGENRLRSIVIPGNNNVRGNRNTVFQRLGANYLGNEFGSQLYVRTHYLLTSFVS